MSTETFDWLLGSTRRKIESIRWNRFPRDSSEAYRSTEPPDSFLTVVCRPVNGRKKITLEDYVFDGQQLRLQYSVRRRRASNGSERRQYAYEVIQWETGSRLPEELVVELAGEIDETEEQ